MQGRHLLSRYRNWDKSTTGVKSWDSGVLLNYINSLAESLQLSGRQRERQDLYTFAVCGTEMIQEICFVPWQQMGEWIFHQETSDLELLQEALRASAHAEMDYFPKQLGDFSKSCIAKPEHLGNFICWLGAHTESGLLMWNRRFFWDLVRWKKKSLVSGI